ncbi:UDP-N-acetylglucosamine transferase subunit ALG14 homolog [Anthonomus grandis grandis]|uniref:UDP-N-acetylglucosamine transferase subunit ALG14 homolog n=1 Tax=Anthonomus grandis grandis TaxID=2921223 RepID=UPI002166C07D|nr:UDP-N-acetylglucosamine transferase subunit ALG14 homolog [Anthonomus grandis grandis]
MDIQFLVEFGFMVLLLILVRITFLIHKITTGYSRVDPKRTKPSKTVICIGSGGHTTEMLTLIKHLNFHNYTPRYYVMAKSDTTSLIKVTTFEESRNAKVNKDYFIIRIPRSRSVGQSYISSVLTTLVSILYSVPIVVSLRPDLILCNGPGTCIPICVLSFLLKCAFITQSKIVFIESFCRTETFSLTGKILTYIADNFIVQWPSLKSKLKRAEYIGQLM